LTEHEYIHKMDHRDQSEQKSQWIISKDSEKECFEKAIHAEWNLPAYRCWGLHFENGEVGYLGKAAKVRSEPRQLFIAKFVDSDQNNKWHGYPVDSCKNQDTPPETVLNDWLQKRYLRQHTIRKITKGQTCKL
jgi:hypothetical protein